MTNNDVLRSVRHMLDISDSKIMEIMKLGGGQSTLLEVIAYLRSEDQEEYQECPHNLMDRFLNGLIYFKRGRDESRPPPSPELPTNNVVLKKLRVAFSLKDDDVVTILKSVGFTISKAEVGALCRRPDQRNFRVCGDQVLRLFLKGLTNHVSGGIDGSFV